MIAAPSTIISQWVPVHPAIPVMLVPFIMMAFLF